MALPKKKRRKKGRLKKVLMPALTVVIAFCLLTSLQVLTLRFLNPPATVSMAWNWLKGQFGSKPYTWPKYPWRSLEDISPHLIKAVLAGEDQRFFSHHGFDLIEMDRALRDALTSGKTRGASTLTMQTARSVFLWPERSFIRKSMEAYYTILIELLWNKRRIVEVYLNTVDWGRGVVGVEAAARRYFRKSSNQLKPSEAAALAAILPSPHRWSPTNPDPVVRGRVERILKDMEHIPLGFERE